MTFYQAFLNSFYNPIIMFFLCILCFGFIIMMLGFGMIVYFEIKKIIKWKEWKK